MRNNVRGQSNEIIKVLKEIKTTYNFISSKSVLQKQRQNILSDKQNLREIIPSRPALHEKLRRFFMLNKNNTR